MGSDWGRHNVEFPAFSPHVRTLLRDGSVHGWRQRWILFGRYTWSHGRHAGSSFRFYLYVGPRVVKLLEARLKLVSQGVPMMSSNVITQYVTPTNNFIVQTYVTSKRLDKQI